MKTKFTKILTLILALLCVIALSACKDGEEGDHEHTLGEYASNGDATCTEDGTVTATCGICGESITVTQEGSALGHTEVIDEAKDATCTEEGRTGGKHCSVCETVIVAQTIISVLDHNYGDDDICDDCGYEKTEPKETYTRSGDDIYFGSWPQSEVTDASLVSTLNTEAGTLPVNGSDNGWTSYKYYISGSNTTDFMWYNDIEYNGEKYRAVYFTSYRPYLTTSSSSASDTFQDDNAYTTSKIYLFKWEPIKWNILTEKNGKALLLCDMLIDSLAYQNCYKNENGNYYDYYATDNNGNILTDGAGNKIYANNYAYSTIREWLSETFYETAFTDMQKSIIQLTNVDNSAQSTTDEDGNLAQATRYVCENTSDYVFLLSENEVTRNAYGFASYSTNDTARQKKITDYAQCQGAYTYSSGTYAGNGYWWLRSPSDYNSRYALEVFLGGYAGRDELVDCTSYGVCPALWIML